MTTAPLSVVLDLLVPVIGLVIGTGLLWQAHTKTEDPTVAILGAGGWLGFALSGFTDGRTEIVILVGALALFGLALLVRRRANRVAEKPGGA